MVYPTGDSRGAMSIQGISPQTLPREETISGIQTFVVEVDSDAHTLFADRGKESSSRGVILFGYDLLDSEEPPLLVPYPKLNPKSRDEEDIRLNQLVYDVLKPDFARSFGYEEKQGGGLLLHQLRFISLVEVIPTLFPYMRHEIGYALRILSEDQRPAEITAPDRLAAAIRNTADMFLLSVGVSRYIAEKDRAQIERTYDNYCSPLGPRLKKPHPDIANLDGVLGAMYMNGEAIGLKVSNDLDDIAALGQGFNYMIQGIANRGGKVDIQLMPRASHNIGSPVGASFVGLKALPE